MKTSFSKDYLIKNSGCYSKDKVNNILNKLPEECTLMQLFDILRIQDFIWFWVNKTKMDDNLRLSTVVYLTNLCLTMYANVNNIKELYDKAIEENIRLKRDNYIEHVVKLSTLAISVHNCNTEEFRNKVKELI